LIVGRLRANELRKSHTFNAPGSAFPKQWRRNGCFFARRVVRYPFHTGVAGVIVHVRSGVVKDARLELCPIYVKISIIFLFCNQ